VPVAPEVGASVVASPARVLELDTHSLSKADPSKSSSTPVSVAPMVSPFLCLDNSESDTEMPKRHASPIPHDDFKDSLDDKEDKEAFMTSMVKNKGLIAEAYEWDEEEVSSDDNERVEVKVLMALVKDNDFVSKEGVRNDEWVKISMRKNLLSKHRDLVQELNTCKEQLLVLKQAILDFLTMQHVNPEILKENKNLRTKLKELTAITETRLNTSNKVNQCISEQISSQKKRILGVDQLNEDPSSSGQKD
nr:hypothetical protein [Tanacetum cinerariifolium]